MGRKVHPYGFRLGVIKDSRSRWYAAEKKTYQQLLIEDRAIRKLVLDKVANAGIADVEIERYPGNVTVNVWTAKPGLVIGRKGITVNDLRKKLDELTKKKTKLEVLEVPKPEINATLIGDSIAQQVEKRISHKRAMKQSVQRAMRAGAKGIKVEMAGRLAGSEMKRRETVKDGRVPLGTLRADIDFARTEAKTTYGKIGIKVWVYHGEILPEDRQRKLEERIARVVESSATN
ncbi:MAG: 30S ribosomal protein S3 [Chloroflexi bacterium UTCFX4]|nr:MAG: 30S ribosomal protein S3 [Chloroflexi bacterium UTCFX4]